MEEILSINNPWEKIKQKEDTPLLFKGTVSRKGDGILEYKCIILVQTKESCWISTTAPCIQSGRVFHEVNQTVLGRLNLVGTGTEVIFEGFGYGSTFFFWSRIRIRIRVKSWIRIRIKAQILELSRLKMEPWRAVDGGIKEWELKIETWRVCRPVVTDSHHLDEKYDPDPHWSELDPDPH
jgi:hypothetical protein